MKIWHMKTWKDFAEIPHQAYVLLLFCLFVFFNFCNDKNKSTIDLVCTM